MLPTSPVGTELLDDPAADPALVASSLRHIVRANRWFGGRAAAVWGCAACSPEQRPGQG